LTVVNVLTKNHYSSSQCMLVNYSSHLFTTDLQCKDCQQLNSTNTDVSVQALGQMTNVYGYAKQPSNEWPIECEDPLSWLLLKFTAL